MCMLTHVRVHPTASCTFLKVGDYHGKGRLVPGDLLTIKRMDSGQSSVDSPHAWWPWWGEAWGTQSQTLLLVLVVILILQFAVGGDVPSPFYFTVTSS